MGTTKANKTVQNADSSKTHHSSQTKTSQTHAQHGNINAPDYNSPQEYTLYLQRTIGNRAVGRLLESNQFSAKLNIGTVNDKYEQEADRVAERVVSMPSDERISPETPAFSSDFGRSKKQVSTKRSNGLPGNSPIGKPVRNTNGAGKLSLTPLANTITPLQRKSEDQDEIQEKEDNPEVPKMGAGLWKKPGENGEAQGKLRRSVEDEIQEKRMYNVQRKCSKCSEEYNSATVQRRPVIASRLCPSCSSKMYTRTFGEVGQTKSFANEKSLGLNLTHLQKKQSMTIAPAATENAIFTAKGGGRSMNTQERSFFEPRFGSDFSNVKIHTGGLGNHLAKSVNARAFTVGNDIFFGRGQYSSDTTEGKKLMAHELTHAVQQGGIQRKELRKAVARGVGLSEDVEQKADFVLQVLETNPYDTNHEARNMLSKLDSGLRAQVVQRVKEKNPNINTSVLEETESKDNERKKKKKGKQSEQKKAKSKKSKPEKPVNAQAQNEESGVVKSQKVKESQAGDESKKQKVQTTEKQEGTAKEKPSFSETMKKENIVPLDKTKEAIVEQAGKAESQTEIILNAESGNSGEKSSATADKIQEKIKNIRQTATGVVQTIQNKISSAKQNISQKVKGLKSSITGLITNKTNDITSNIDKHSKAVEVKISKAHTGLRKLITKRRAEINKKGSDLQARTDQSIISSKENIENMTNAYVQKVQVLGPKEKARATKILHRKASLARTYGTRYANSFPNTERGNKQGEAALEVAHEVAGEITEPLPEIHDSIDELTSELPDKFREKGNMALEKFDRNTPKIKTEILRLVSTPANSLAQQITQIGVLLSNLQNRILNLLTQQKHRVKQKAELLRTQLHLQLDSSANAANTNLDNMGRARIDHLNEQADKAIDNLEEVQSPDTESLELYSKSVTGFLNNSAFETVTQIQTAEKEIKAGQEKSLNAAGEGMGEVKSQNNKILQRIDDSVNTKVSELQNNMNTQLDTLSSTLTQNYQQAERNVNTQIKAPGKELKNSFVKTYKKTKDKVTESVDKGLEKTNEALSGLFTKMRAAAEKAAWRHDHPILARVFDVLSFIGGLLLGILAVLALIVVFIVVAKMLLVGMVAGLVFLGVSFVTATLIAKVVLIVAAIGLLAYGIYNSYQSHREQGKGGWSAFGHALLDITGISSIIESGSAEGISPFERGRLFGSGITTLFLTLLGGRQLYRGLKPRVRTGFRNVRARIKRTKRNWRRSRERTRERQRDTSREDGNTTIDLDENIKIPGRVQSRINIRKGDATVKGSGLNYSIKNHGGTGPKSKSQFSINEQEIVNILSRKSLIRVKPRVSGDSGNYIRTYNTGKIIGNLPINKGGQPTSWITVITDKFGNLVNTFPGTLGRKASL